ncbi:MAG: DUF58 domain-containing protein [Colwellia sp.]|nr:DUF58 domain-containing protein [Colwellia sp.]MCW9080219.1 DUF58 domain-containing protein [Colwellia sp.]
MVVNYLKSTINNRFDTWLKRRVPSRFHHKLSRRNIFIMPTKFGFAYLFFVFLLFLLATNYQNNIIMLMSYLLASFFITVMMHSFYNFSGLEFTSPAKHAGFAKQSISLPISIIAKRPHFDLTISFAKQVGKQQFIHLKQCKVGCTEVSLPFIAEHRGVIEPGRIKISSEYAFGLFISWAVLDFSHQFTIYPQPKKVRTNQYRSADQSDNSGSSYSNQSAGSDDFSELKDYVIGESRARTAWKQFARGQGRYTKHYQNQQGSLHWLKLGDMPTNNLEEQLSFLCYLVLEYSNKEQNFGLDLTQRGDTTINTISPNTGQEHQKLCLSALAHVKQQA